MDTNNSTRTRFASKSFYLFLCSILGVMLFVIIQRAVGLIYLLLLTLNYQQFNFGLSMLDLWVLNYLTYVAAVLFGAWYGIWLGLHWYRIVYEEGKGGLFHGFKLTWSRGSSTASQASKPPTAAAGSAPASVTVKPVRRVEQRTFAGAPKAAESSWEFDDLLNQKSEPAVPAEPDAELPAKRSRTTVKTTVRVTAKSSAKTAGKSTAKPGPRKATKRKATPSAE